MSTTIRILKKDKERLARLAEKTGRKKLAEAFRFALSAAEREADQFHGNIRALTEAQKSAGESGGRVSERVDEELSQVLTEEISR